MKKINWKLLIITSVITLLPIILGIAFYQDMPEQMAIHFNINNEPDNYASRNFVIFGLPILMVCLQVFCCIVTDIQVKEKGEKQKIEYVVKSIIPVLSIIVYTLTILFSLGNQVDIRKIICFVIGALMIVMGNYLPKTSLKGNMRVRPKILIQNEKLGRSALRCVGFTMVITGILLILSILFAPVYSIAVLVLLIIITLIEFFYFISKALKEKKK